MNAFTYIYSRESPSQVLAIRKQVYCEEEGRNESTAQDDQFGREEHIYVEDGRTKRAAGVISFSIYQGLELQKILNCSGLDDTQLVGVIAKLLLVKAYRGKPFLAVSLMFLAYEHLIRRNVREILVAIYASRRDAISMYERLGLTHLPGSQGPPGKILMYLKVEPGYALALRKRCFIYLNNQKCISMPYRLPLELEKAGFPGRRQLYFPHMNE